jgi:two-component system, sensor histidine kinase and response regulator
MINEAESGRTFHCAIIDHLPPNIDGEFLGEKIKAHPMLNKTELILITYTGMRGDASRLKRKGFAAYLTKPVENKQLLNCLKTVLGKEAKSQSSPEKSAIVTKHSISEAEKQNLRILLAEDNIVNMKLALRLLEKLGYQADSVSNGREAIEALEKTSYDLVLMDVQMPVMDGFEAVQQIRKIERKSKKENGARPPLPIIAMTAHAMKGDRERCIEAGMNDYVSKPIDPKELAEKIAQWSVIKG